MESSFIDQKSTKLMCWLRWASVLVHSAGHPSTLRCSVEAAPLHASPFPQSSSPQRKAAWLEVSSLGPILCVLAAGTCISDLFLCSDGYSVPPSPRCCWMSNSKHALSSEWEYGKTLADSFGSDWKQCYSVSKIHVWGCPIFPLSIIPRVTAEILPCIQG